MAGCPACARWHSQTSHQSMCACMRFACSGMQRSKANQSSTAAAQSSNAFHNTRVVGGKCRMRSPPVRLSYYLYGACSHLTLCSQCRITRVLAACPQLSPSAGTSRLPPAPFTRVATWFISTTCVQHTTCGLHGNRQCRTSPHTASSILSELRNTDVHADAVGVCILHAPESRCLLPCVMCVCARTGNQTNRTMRAAKPQEDKERKRDVRYDNTALSSKFLTARLRRSASDMRSCAMPMSTRARAPMSLKSCLKWNVTLSITTSLTCVQYSQWYGLSAFMHAVVRILRDTSCAVCLRMDA